MKVNPADLRRVNALKEAPEEDLKLLLERSILRSIEEGEFFFFQGDPALYAYLLISGRVKLLQSNPSGQQVNLRTIGEWELFAVLGAVRSDATYPVTAQALESCSALAIESSFLREMMQTRPYLNFGLMQMMTGYIQEIQERYRELATERAERRLALTILRLASQIGKQVGKAIELPLSRQDLAEASGSTMFTVSRTLAAWERRGLVEAGRERILIRNPHGLVEIAEGLDQS
ncbi:MAG TPA: Crp/Fnr family transcriptional regulator [Anaerolineales bacterium]|nr:Crp/Fnr family transcriptional regulator [Anaerolineales bacterium]